MAKGTVRLTDKHEKQLKAIMREESIPTANKTYIHMIENYLSDQRLIRKLSAELGQTQYKLKQLMDLLSEKNDIESQLKTLLAKGE